MGHGMRKPTGDKSGSRTLIFIVDANHFVGHCRIVTQIISATTHCFHRVMLQILHPCTYKRQATLKIVQKHKVRCMYNITA